MNEPTNAGVSVPDRHPATAKGWAWLESRTTDELDAEQRDHIAGLLMEMDAELHKLDATVTPASLRGVVEP